MYCNNCGEKINDSSKHCPLCGVTITKEEKIKPKKRRLLEGAVPITVFVVAMVLFPFVVLGVNIASIIISPFVLLTFGWAIVFVWKTHMYFENDTSFKIVEWFGIKKTTYNYSDIGYVKTYELRSTSSTKYGPKELRKIEIYGKAGIKLFDYTYSARILEWFRYYDVEIRKEYI